MFCDLNFRQDEGVLQGLEKDGYAIFQGIRQRQGCEQKQAIYTVARRRKSRIFFTVFSLLLDLTPYYHVCSL